MNSPHEIPAGRPIRLVPTPPGLWLMIGGGLIASLGPLFGFLIGSLIGDNPIAGQSPIYLFLFLGLVVGAVGIGMIVLGGVRLYRHLNPQVT